MMDGGCTQLSVQLWITQSLHNTMAITEIIGDLR